MAYTGTQVNYFLVCPRKLWLFSHDLTMEDSSELVELGRLIHETSYARRRKEIRIGRIVIDFAEAGGVIHEVKKSNRLEEAHRYQLLYYLYYLKGWGVSGLRGELNYPKLRQRVAVELTPAEEQKLEAMLGQMEAVIVRTEPPGRLEKNSICKKCSYYELCYV
ncbi:MAG TPA: CRISPR-associated protein Cas4 [Candidatus Fraserbacteria bacterium]|nr:CRISPR-associated protein Cas4 [Candidatus Fraserbacteria bacterium]